MAGSYWTWDDYLRLANNRRGRQCIQPEVCRNFNFGVQVRKENPICTPRVFW